MDYPGRINKAGVAGNPEEEIMKTRNTMMTVAVAVLLVAGVALAQGRQGEGAQTNGNRDGDGPHGPRGSRGNRIERLAERLDLTDEQKTAIEGIHEKTRTANQALAKETRLLKHELEGELLKDEPSEIKVLELNKKLGELQIARKANGLKAKLAVREELTPEQRDKMLAMGDRFGRKGGKGGHRGFRGSGQGRGQGCNQDCSHGRGGRGSR